MIWVKVYKKLKVLLLAAAYLLVCQPASAERVYTCNIGGETVYTSHAQPSCNQADLPSIGHYSSSSYQSFGSPNIESESVSKKHRVTKRRKHLVASKTRENNGFAPVIPATRTSSAVGGRKAILEQELGNEQKALASARTALNAAHSSKLGSTPQSINQLKADIADRQQNIQALKRELGRL